MDAKLKAKLSAKSKWMRLLFIILFLIIICIVKIILWFVTALQFIIVLFTDKPNQMLLEFGGHLSVYIAQIFRFLTYNSDEHPYPFSPWPGYETIEKKEIKKRTRVKKRRGRKKKSV